MLMLIESDCINALSIIISFHIMLIVLIKP